MNRNRLNDKLYGKLKEIKVYADTNHILIESALKKLELNYKYIVDDINYLDDAFVFECQKTVYVIRLNAVNYDYNKRRKNGGAGQHFHVVPTVPQLFELKKVVFDEVKLSMLGFNSFFCHEDEYSDKYSESDYIAPAGSIHTHLIYNNMPYLDCSADVEEQIQHYLKCESICSDNAFKSPKTISDNIFGRGGYLSSINSEIIKCIMTCKDELNGDAIYSGRFYSSYFKAIKKEGKIIYSPFSYNYKLFNEKNTCER